MFRFLHVAQCLADVLSKLIEQTFDQKMWKFHRLCGKNIYLDNNSTTAKRLNQTKENYYGVVVTNQPLVNGEVFEIQIDKSGGGLFDSVALGKYEV